MCIRDSPLKVRAKVIEAIRATMRENGAALAKAAHDETGLGRFEDKIVKNALVTERTPGLEDLSPSAVTGDRGLTLVCLLYTSPSQRDRTRYRMPSSA